MRTITIQADKALNEIMEQWLVHLLIAIPTGPDGGGIHFDGDTRTGTVIAQRQEGRWSVSFRPVGGDSSRRQCYTSPYEAVRAILAGPHPEEMYCDGHPEAPAFRS
jgi:hypothetical protein